MATETDWNEGVCPNCRARLSGSDMRRIRRLAQINLEQTGGVSSLGLENNWHELSCGHRVEVAVHTTAEGFNYKLIDRPRPAPDSPGGRSD